MKRLQIERKMGMDIVCALSGGYRSSSTYTFLVEYI